MSYKIFRKILFLLPSELAHRLVIRGLQLMHSCRLSFLCKKTIEKPMTLQGIRFINPIGVAAGFDKYAEAILGLQSLGVGFAELGTFTPKPQQGNPKPRLFRLIEDKALINRMGLNNCGIDAAIARLQKIWPIHFPIGISITKGNDTPYENAVEDYLYCLEKAYPYCHYITANISCPNVQKPIDFYSGPNFESLLNAIKHKQSVLKAQYDKYVPIFIKMGPDLSDAEIQAFAMALNLSGLQGVVATNTTIIRAPTLKSMHKHEKGGLSGEPLFLMSLHCIKELKKHLKPELILIGVGGIHSAETAKAMIDAGCNLLQLYTGLIYEGSGLIRKIVKGL